MHTWFPDLWSRYGIGWGRLDGVWWDELLVMVSCIEADRRARSERS